MGNHNRLILTAMLVALAHSASSSLQVAASANLLDLSYLHRVKSTTLADAIKEAFGADVQDLDIDISSSMIRKDINDLLTALEGRESSSVRLAVRRNQWSPDEAATLLNAIVGTDNNTRKDEGNSNPQTKDDSEFNGKTSEKEGNQDPPDTDLIESMETVAPGFASIASLDLSWNDLSHNHRGSKNFLKYLQKTIQDSRKCPSILRFDVCGLGPSACRALGKVRFDHSNVPTQRAL